MKIIDTVDQIPRCQNRRIHIGHEKARTLLRHVNVLMHLPRVEVADLCGLADLQIVCTRCSGCAARHGHRRKIRLCLEHDCHLLRLCGVIQVVVEDARIPRHRIAVENAALLDILRTVREEQCAARVVGLHRPAMHEM